MLSRLWKATLLWVAIAAIALQGTVAPARPRIYGKNRRHLQRFGAQLLPADESPGSLPQSPTDFAGDVGFGMTSTFGGPVRAGRCS